MGHAEVCVCLAFRRWERLPSSGDHLLDREVTTGTAWAYTGTEIKQIRIRAVVVREPAAISSHHCVQEAAMLKALGQGLATPFVGDGLILVGVPNEKPF